MAALTRYDAAVRAHALCGAGDPEDVPHIDQEYREAYSQLQNMLDRLETSSMLFERAIVEGQKLFELGSPFSDLLPWGASVTSDGLRILGNALQTALKVHPDLYRVLGIREPRL